MNILVKVSVFLVLAISIVHSPSANDISNPHRFDHKLILKWNEESSKWTEMSKDISYTILSIEGIPINTHTIEVCGKNISISEKLVYSMYVKCTSEYTKKGQVKINLFSSDENYFSSRLEKINPNSGRVQIIFVSTHQIKEFIPFTVENNFPEYSLFMK